MRDGLKMPSGLGKAACCVLQWNWCWCKSANTTWKDFSRSHVKWNICATFSRGKRRVKYQVLCRSVGDEGHQSLEVVLLEPGIQTERVQLSFCSYWWTFSKLELISLLESTKVLLFHNLVQTGVDLNGLEEQIREKKMNSTSSGRRV